MLLADRLHLAAAGLVGQHGLKIYFAAGFQRQQLAACAHFVAQQHNRLAVGQVGARLKGGVADRALGSVNVHIRIFKQAKAEFFLQQQLYRLVNQGHELGMGAHGLYEAAGVGCARKQVDAGLQGSLVARYNAERLYPPGHHVDRTGIRIDDAPESQLPAQQVLQHAFVVGIGDLLIGGADGNGVVGHDGGGAGSDGGPEGDEVALQLSARKQLPLAPVKVGVLPAFGGTAARKVLGREGYRLRPQLRTLKAQHYLPDHVGRKVGIFAKGAFHPLPAGLSAQVGHIHIAFAQAHSPPLLPGYVGKFAGKPQVAHGRQPEFARPYRKRRGAHAQPDGGIHGDVVARVGAHYGRYAETVAFAQRLQVVGPGGYDAGRRLGAQDEVAFVKNRDVFGGAGRRQVGLRQRLFGKHVDLHQQVLLVETAADRLARARRLKRPVVFEPRRADEHEAGFLLEAHARPQVAGTGLVAQPPVFVSVELPVFVEVFKLVAVYLQQPQRAVAQHGLLPGVAVHRRRRAAAACCEQRERQAVV